MQAKTRKSNRYLEHLSPRVRILLAVYLVFYNLWGESSASPASGNFGTNEVFGTKPESDEPLELGESLLLCQRKAICGQVEVNAFGVSAVPLCNCRTNRPGCSLTWDEHDGRSITIGSKQYKFCERTYPLSICNANQKAYVTSYSFHPSNFKMILGAHRLYCYCPANRVLTPSFSDEEFMNGMMVMKSIHKCSPLPSCQKDEPCKEVSRSEFGSNVAVKCGCHYPLVCPTLAQDTTPHGNDYNRGTAYSIYCQAPYR